MNRYLLSGMAIIALAVLPLLPQGAPQLPRPAAPVVAPQRPGMIRGIVIREGTNEPLADVQITAGNSGTTPPTQLTAVTDSGGRFLLNNVPPGARNVIANLDGYWGPENNGNRPVNSSKNVMVMSDMTTDVTITMTPSGTISGRVYDVNGKVISDVMVVAYLMAYQEGAATLQQRVSRTTDDRGEFRLFKLPPGTYYVAATPRQVGYRGAAADSGVQSVTVRTYYLNVPDPGLSAPLTVRGDEEMSGVDIRLATAVIGKISGQVINTIPPAESITRGGARGARGERGAPQAAARGVAPTAAQGNAPGFATPNATVSLFPHDRYGPQDFGFGSMSVSMDSPNNGHFEFRNVVPGTYDLYASLPDNQGYGPQAPAGQATNPLGYGRTTIEVRGGDVDGVTITVHPGVDLKGRLTVDGIPAEAPDNVRISLQPADSSTRLGEYGQVSRLQPMIGEDGSFVIPAVPEAHYRVQVQVTGAGQRGNGPGGGSRGAPGPGARGRGANADPLAASPIGPPVKANAYVADILMGGISVYDTGIDIGPNSPPQLEVALKTDPSSVGGTVFGANQSPVQGIMVALVPVPQHRQNTALYKNPTTGPLGRFMMNSVVPGDYKLFAFESVPNGAYQNADFIKKYEERGVSITVMPNSTMNVQLSVIPRQ